MDEINLDRTGIADRLIYEALIIKFQDKLDFSLALDFAARRIIIQGQADALNTKKGKRR